MYQKLYKLKCLRSEHIRRLVVLCTLPLLVSACRPYDSCGIDGCVPDGLVVGAVINAHPRPALKTYQRWRYTDQLASQILSSHPELSGHVDSYEYLSKRMGGPLTSLLQSYRLEGDLSERALDAFHRAELRRRYLLLARILPNEQSFPLKPDVTPVIGHMNREVQDYYDLNRQTILLTGVHVQVYDTISQSKVFDKVISSDEGDRMLATQSSSRKYVGNSLLASISNSLTNALNGSATGAYPAPPKRDHVLNHIWLRVAEQLPGAVF